MNELKIFSNPDFGQLRTLIKNNETWFVGKDAAEILGYSNTQKAIRDHVDTEDKLTERFVLSGQNREAVVVNESGLYSLVLSSKLPNVKKFKRWVTSEVLPSIRKHGMYTTAQTIETMLADSDNAIRMLTALKEERAKRIEQEKQIASLTAENQMQAQQIAEFEPVKTYVDKILTAPAKTMTTTQIASDYGLTAGELYTVLHATKLVFKSNNSWVLRKEHSDKNYATTETKYIRQRNGKDKVIITLKWTQKGRQKIDELINKFSKMMTERHPNKYN